MDHRTLLLRSALLLLSGLAVTWVAPSAASDSGAAFTGTDQPSERGDVDKDGDVDSIDALVILRDIAGLGKLEFPDNADVDGDGDIDVTDALHIVRFVAGLAPLPGAPSPTATPECSPWPPEVSAVLERLSVVEGLCLLRFSDPSEFPFETECPIACYYALSRQVWCLAGCPIPFQTEVWALTHEICHAHQHRVVLDAGLPVTNGRGWGDDDSWGLDYVQETPEGSSFIELGAWRLEDGEWIPQQELGWWSGSPNPLEDAASVCTFWYRTREDLESAAPIRYEWAQQWLPP